jgi:hypothetical protein
MNPYIDDLISFVFETNIMKTVLKFISYALVAGIVIFISCGKNLSDRGAPPAPQPADTLSGREFEFNDLTWRETPEWTGNVLVDITDRPDLFFNPYRTLKASIKLDTSAVWLNVLQDTGYPYLAGSNFYYGFFGISYYVFGRFYIFPFPANLPLKGTKVSVRVKFI